MTRTISTNERADVAQRMQDRGYAPLLLIALSKRPVDSEWQTGSPGNVANRLRWNPDKNLGWRMGIQPNGKRLLALDDDGGLAALETKIGWLPPTWTQSTPAGGKHRVFRVPSGVELGNRVRFSSLEVDVRCDRGYIVCAPSELDDRDKQTAGFYAVTQSVALAELPAPWLACLRKVEPPPPVPLPEHLEPSLERALAYTAQCEPAVSGQGGHQATFRVACKCVEFALSIMDTLTVLREFNRRCDPAWSEAELRHKAESAHGVARVQRGGKLAGRAARERGVR